MRHITKMTTGLVVLLSLVIMQQASANPVPMTFAREHHDTIHMIVTGLIVISLIIISILAVKFMIKKYGNGD